MGHYNIWQKHTSHIMTKSVFVSWAGKINHASLRRGSSPHGNYFSRRLSLSLSFYLPLSLALLSLVYLYRPMCHCRWPCRLAAASLTISDEDDVLDVFMHAAAGQSVSGFFYSLFARRRRQNTVCSSSHM